MHSTPYKIDKSKDYRKRSSFSLQDNNFIALFALIVLTCLITFWVWADRDPKEMKYAYICSRVALGDRYRLFTWAFLHVDKSHLTDNMTELLIYGLLLCYRTKISNRKFCLFYLSAILFSCYFAHHRYYMHRLFDTTVIGASGSVSAVQFATLLVGFPPTKEKNANVMMRILNIILFFSFFFDDYNKLSTSQSQIDGIAHEVHFGGALCGIFFTVLCYPNLIFANMFASTPAPPKDKAADLHATAPLY